MPRTDLASACRIDCVNRYREHSSQYRRAKGASPITWFKVDDRLHGHRKARIAGPAAMGLWVLAGSWAADQLTDGFVPRPQVFVWAENALELAARLVDVGLWEATVHLGEDGWLFHDWIDFQPTKADVIARREVEREKKRRQRSCPPGTTPGNPPGSPGTGIASGSKENPYPESPGDTSNFAHAFTAAAGGECAECGLPAGNRRHIRIVEAS